jgi:hypothetical protein
MTPQVPSRRVNLELGQECYLANNNYKYMPRKELYVMLTEWQPLLLMHGHMYVRT